MKLEEAINAQQQAAVPTANAGPSDAQRATALAQRTLVRMEHASVGAPKTRPSAHNGKRTREPEEQPASLTT